MYIYEYVIIHKIMRTVNSIIIIGVKIKVFILLFVYREDIVK